MHDWHKSAADNAARKSVSLCFLIQLFLEAEWEQVHFWGSRIHTYNIRILSRSFRQGKVFQHYLIFRLKKPFIHCVLFRLVYLEWSPFYHQLKRPALQQNNNNQLQPTCRAVRKHQLAFVLQPAICTILESRTLLQDWNFKHKVFRSAAIHF